MSYNEIYLTMAISIFKSFKRNFKTDRFLNKKNLTKIFVVKKSIWMYQAKCLRNGFYPLTSEMLKLNHINIIEAQEN